ncbi:MAG TPA: methyltransferase domain-containing protein [Opitutaceae bacterium]|jgi:predicted SAM-dependent methyltransferase
MTLKQRVGRWVAARLPINEELLTELRFETNASLCRLRSSLSPTYRAKIRALGRQTGLNLNVGSGGRGLPGWLNTDAVAHPLDQTFSCDIRKRLPLADGSVARIFAEHIIEHINLKHDLPRVLSEFLRVLQSGGMLRIIVPDGKRFVEAYLSNDPAEWACLGFEKLPADMPTPMMLLNHVFHQGGEHHFAYDFETLAWALGLAGFKDIRRQEFGKSSDPALAIDRREHAPYSLYVEASRP